MKSSFAGHRVCLDSKAGIVVQYNDTTGERSEFGLEMFRLVPLYFVFG